MRMRLARCPAVCVEDDIEPYICCTIDDKPIRIIVADTSKPNCHSGGLSDQVAEWLEKKIVDYPDKPTIVFSHHLPFETGLPAMDEGFDQTDRFGEILNLHKNVKFLVHALKGIRLLRCKPTSRLSIFPAWQQLLCLTVQSNGIASCFVELLRARPVTR